MRLSFLLLSSLGLWAASPAPATTPPPAATPAPAADTLALTQALQAQWQGSDLPGFAVAVVGPQGILYEHGFGLADKARRRPYSPATVQCVGSISKTLIGVALLQAQAAGKLRLDQPVNELLPFRVENPYFPTQPITLRQLATMTGSLTDDQRFYSKRAYAPGPVAPISSEEYLRRTLGQGGQWLSKKRFVPHAPGTYYAYSNESAALAALALERATGQPYDQYTRQHILQPLGITDAWWYHPEVDTARRATLYDQRGRPVKPYTTITYPDGGLFTSAHSLARYLHAISNPAVPGAPLTAALRDSLIRPQFGAAPPQHLDPAEPNQGLFWAIRRNGTVGHTGGDTGLSTFMFYDPRTGLGKVFVTNCEVHQGERSKARFAAIWKLLDEVR